MSTGDEPRQDHDSDHTAHGDEVDKIVTEWSRERPDLDPTPLTVLSRITRLGRHLERMRRSVFAAHSLEPFEFDVLTALRRTGPPYELSAGALLTQTLVSSGAMTNRVDRMVDHGLVERRTDPSDRRVVLVRLTPEGRRRVDGAFAELLDRERDVLTALSDDERRATASALRSLMKPFEDG